jgi:SAM-dependent methyltransferase
MRNSGDAAERERTRPGATRTNILDQVTRQNVYDDEAFFTGYQHLRGAEAGLNAALEQPALRALLPDVTGADAVDLGCGDGQLSRELVERGARSVLGVDPSARMLSLAVARSPDPRLRFEQRFAEDTAVPPGSIDLVVSSLALHYVADFEALTARIATWLRPGGRLVASMEHPVVTAPCDRGGGDGPGIDDYAEQGPRQTSWFIDGVVKYHRTVSAIVNAVLHAGLTLERLEEPAPSPADLMHRPDLRIHRRRPALLLLRAGKPPAP